MLAQPGDVFLLIGQLGAGKTRLTQGILNGLGSENIARSPTFVMVTEHLNGRLPLYHMDLYRIGSSDDLTELGLDEYLYGDGLSVVEWPDRVPDAFPRNHLEVRIEVLSGSKRQLTISGSDKYENILGEMFRY